MTRTTRKPLKVFCSYSRQDEHYLEMLKTWLIGLEREGLIEQWHDRMISPGDEWDKSVAENLATSDLVLLLITPDFIASQYIYEKEMSRAVERHRQGRARVIPIIVRPSPPLSSTPFRKLQALPKDAKPVTTWPNQDEAWLDVLRGIQQAIEELLFESQSLGLEQSSEQIYREAVEWAWADGELHSREAERLSDLAGEYELSTDSASAIEREVMGDTKEAILEPQEQAGRGKERKEQPEARLESVKALCIYSHRDEHYLEALKTWLVGLYREGLIEQWHDRKISPGQEWDKDIADDLKSADMVLLLVTPDFMASAYVYEKEISLAEDRHARGKARVIPIIVRPADWEWASFGKLQALPKDAKPITRWPDRDEAWLDVLKGIQQAVEELLFEPQSPGPEQSEGPLRRYREMVEWAWSGGILHRRQAERVRTLANKLDLNSSTAADIEREVMGDTIETILVRQEDAAREEKRQKRLGELYDQARRSHQDQEWQAVVDVFEQIHAEDPAYADREDLLASAREALEAQEAGRKVAALYAEGQGHMDAGKWQQALECFEEVQRLEPGYQDTEELLSQVRQELAPPSMVEVPDLSGERIVLARRVLSQRSLRLGTQNEASSEMVPPGHVIEQSPEAGTEAEAGSLVSVTVSSGPSPAKVSEQPAPEQPNVVSPETMFISYSRKDWNDFVEPLVNDLRQQGLKVWTDQNFIKGGRRWKDAIQEALDTCERMVVCVSPDSLTSQYVKDEYRYFVDDDNKEVFPLICRTARLPWDLKGIQYFSYQERDKLIETL
jgi:tetratricopeptide (TPR) repeat protein